LGAPSKGTSRLFNRSDIDLARFTFLLGHDDREQLFGTEQP
jgi:hypothetical protein